MENKQVVLCPPCGESGLKGRKGVIRHGFTLIELLVVVLIIGILAAVALPQYQKAVYKARAVEMITFLDAVAKGMDLWQLENGGVASDSTFGLADLDIDVSSQIDSTTSTSKSGTFQIFLLGCGGVKGQDDAQCSVGVDVLFAQSAEASILYDKDFDGVWHKSCNSAPTGQGATFCKVFNSLI